MLSRYIPWIIFVFGLIPVFIGINYRTNDYVTSTYLFLYSLPVIGASFLLAVLYYFFDKNLWKKIVLYSEIAICLGLYVLLIIYIVRFN